MIKQYFRKFREHLLTTYIVDRQNISFRLQNEILKGMIFNNTIVESQWLKHKSFSPGRAAADYGLLFTMYRVLDSVHPKNILECGLGQSSKLIHQYAAYYNANAVTLEHDQNWIDFFNLSKTGDYPVNTHLIPLKTVKYNGCETLSYDGIEDYLKDKKFDFVFVDGPFGSPNYSRSQIIDIAANNLADDFCLILDDVERKGEQETVKEIEKALKDKGVDFSKVIYSASKDHVLFCSPNWHFLTSL